MRATREWRRQPPRSGRAARHRAFRAHDGFADQKCAIPRRAQPRNVVTRLNAALGDREYAARQFAGNPEQSFQIDSKRLQIARIDAYQVQPASSERASSASSCASQSTSKPWVRAEAASAARSCC